MIFSERRLAVVLSVFMLSVFFLCVLEYKFINITAVILGILTAAFIVLRFILKKSRENNKLLPVSGYILLLILPAFIAVIFCVLHYNISEKPVLNYLEEYKDTPVHIKAEIQKVSSLTYMSKFDLKVYEINGQKTKKFNLSLTIFGGIEAGDDELGHILETTVILKNLNDSLTSDLSIAYSKSEGYYIASEYAESDSEEENSVAVKISPAASRSLNYYFESMRYYTRDVLLKNIKLDYHDTKTQEAALVFGIFTGDRSYINSSVDTDFKKSGISHALSVSGMHLSIICGIIFAFFNLFKVHKRISCIVIILMCLFFMAFTGFSLPVIRSGIMMILFYTAFLFGRKSDSLSSLLFAGTFIIFLNPYNVLNIGFQLSFFATLGIIAATGINSLVTAKLNSIKKFKILINLSKIIITSLIITIAATVFTLPFTSYNFKTLSLIAPLTNLITSPLITAVLFLSICIMIFSFVSFIPFIITIFCMPAYYITKMLLYITNILGSFKYSYIAVESTKPTGFYIFSVIFLLLIILCFIIPKISAKKFIKPVLFSLSAIVFVIMTLSLIYPRIIFKNSVRLAYYSDDKNQNIILFQKDYDSVDIIDITHGTQSHIKSVYDIITENGALNINSIILTDYRKRHVQMIKKYMTYSNINKVYIPEPLDDYDVEVLNMLYYLSLTENFELIKYGNSLKFDNVLIDVINFDYNKMRHTAVNINCDTVTTRKKILYLGIGYKEGYAEYTDINNNNYDVVFYGTHKHNSRDDDYISDIYGSYAGVLSGYLDGNKNKTYPKLEETALEKYRSGSVLFMSENYKSVVFEINKNGGIQYYLK